ncbi:hypothetical protein [Sinanaerobacter chloroacetimidivorans]|jgi:uncharacterized membrane protein YjgN (DUF898 family)|uniref:Uncharacterized protein n=1 Tax=Sinanaerobacter chloroacetimidivorans TaxID=2818044 RepID=A0A8J7W2N2_9FIRM|nr:hypothetical protein [Sinanaerobacter chloroacetimidivorans]MBR0598053.1 hypothetical protein [Sinanaerobacter chloroacetimidivorans]
MKKKNRIFPYVAYGLRIFMGIWVISISFIIWYYLKNNAHTFGTQVLCLLIPAAAITLVAVDLYFHYKDIKLLKNR